MSFIELCQTLNIVPIRRWKLTSLFLKGKNEFFDNFWETWPFNIFIIET
jgi:hypothetical protein